MILFPAIDLKDGQCVRLEKGLMEKVTVFNDDPAAQARAFQDAGVEWLHLVDLNGAFEGRPVNAAAVESILKAIDIPVQLGGGIRTMAIAETWLTKGVKRIILGTAALTDPDFVRDACKAFPGRVAVGLDAKGGKVAVQGWAEVSDVTVEEMAKRFEDAGVAAIIHTDIDRDGVLQGVNLEATVALAQATPIPVIASGGVSSLEDIKRLLAAPAPGVAGVISGRAIYDGRLDIAEALALIAVRS